MNDKDRKAVAKLMAITNVLLDWRDVNCYLLGDNIDRFEDGLEIIYEVGRTIFNQVNGGEE